MSLRESELEARSSLEAGLLELEPGVCLSYAERLSREVPRLSAMVRSGHMGQDMPGCPSHSSLGKCLSPMYPPSVLKDKVEERLGQLEGSKQSPG